MVKQRRYILLDHTSISLFLVLLIILTGCGTTKSSRFYTLNSLKTQDTVQKTTSPDRDLSVGIGPVSIPDYLERPQIVSRTSQNELYIDEFNRWAGSLDSDISRVLSENLSSLLSEEHISVLTLERAAPVGYRIIVNVTRFDLMPDNTFLLKTQWSISGKDGKKVLMRESYLSEHIDGKDYGARVAAMSRAIEMLSRDIAGAMKPLIQAARK
jgi:hypothetical protein